MSGFAIFLLLAAAGLRFIWKRRVFERTNAAGIERFDSYTGKIRSQSFDWILKFGSLLAFAAGVIILSFVHVDTWGWVVIAPILAFILYLLIGT